VLLARLEDPERLYPLEGLVRLYPLGGPDGLENLSPLGLLADPANQ